MRDRGRLAATGFSHSWPTTTAAMGGNELYLYNPEGEQQPHVHELLQVGAEISFLQDLMIALPFPLANLFHDVRIFQSEGDHPSFLFEGSSSPGPRVIEFYAPW